MMVPANPPTRNFRPLRSSVDLISLRNQPPICAPVLPVGMPWQLYSLSRVVEHVLPATEQQPRDVLAGVEPERQRCAEGKRRVLAPIIIQRRIAHLDGAVRNGREHLQP